MQNEECRMQNGFLYGKLVGKMFLDRKSPLAPYRLHIEGLEKLWQTVKGLKPENEEGFAKGWLVGAGFPLPEQDWRGYDG